MDQANWIDRAIGYVAPQRAAKRVEARNRIARAATARNLYEAATVSRRTQGWRRVGTDGNAEARTALGPLREVARDMVRNNAYAARAKAAITYNVVGTGILPSVRSAREPRAKKIKDLTDVHFGSTDIDADGRLNLYGLQALAMATVVESGEVLVRRRPRRVEDGLALPFQLQILEPDFLDTSVEGQQPNGTYAFQGVEFNRIGKRVAYHLFDEHPGALGAKAGAKSRRISADFVTHIYRNDIARPGQVRGVTWFAPVIMRMRDFADYCDATLMKQKIAACYVAFVTTADPNEGVPGNPQGISSSGYPIESFEPGMIERLGMGESVTFGTPPKADDVGPYGSITLHEIAAGLNIPYETLTTNLSEVTFISGRLGRQDFHRMIDASRWNMLIPQMMDPIARWTNEAAQVVTGSTEPFWFLWTPPPWEMLDPAAEVAGAKDAIRAGLSWQSEEIRKRGYDPEELYTGAKADQQRMDRDGLVFDTDPRRLTAQGQQQNQAAPN